MHSSTPSARFRFIADALRAEGGFRPVVAASADGSTLPPAVGPTYLVRYPRESEAKFARRNDVAFYASPLARACARFVGFLASRAPTRELPHDLYRAMASDIDGRGNALDVWLLELAIELKARGSMLLLVDNDADVAQAGSLGEQVRQRRAPFWTMVFPEAVTDFAVGEDGRFDFVEFAGNVKAPSGEVVDCTWRFDRSAWAALDRERSPIAAGEHPLGECPVLAVTESGAFPHFGPFSAIADLARRLFNLDSELDEILRSQTFSLLTMQVPENATDAQKLDAAKIAGQTIGTSNLLVHSGSTPAFVAPPDGPARVYLDRIADVRRQIGEIGLDVVTEQAQESGIARQIRFAAVNGELAKFAGRLEDAERRAWDLSRRWLGMQSQPTVTWPRDYNLADVEHELIVLREMRATSMPTEAIVEQERRIVGIQFAGLDQDRLQAMLDAIDERLLQRDPEPGTNVVPLRAQDPNAELRGAVVRALNGSA